ncbi:uncharacterized protein [Ptychodera flava]|uniref:uncharacterized protein n=1 Tax=Ptychodera flava TaxID=63121 RepID=UPI00396A26E9
MVILYVDKPPWIRENEKYATDRGKKKTGLLVVEDHGKANGIKIQPTKPYLKFPTLGDINTSPVGYYKVKPKSSPEVVFSDNTDNPTRYLLPMKSILGGGANSQYLRFKVAARFAVLTNRTLVTTPFFLNGGHEMGFSEENMRSFESTFDVNKMEKLLPLATVDKYVHECNDKRSTVLAWDVHERYEQAREKVFEHLLGIKVPKLDQVTTWGYDNDFEDVIDDTENETCLVFSIDGKFVFRKGHVKDDIAKAVDKHLIPTKEVRMVAEYFSDKICKGESYLVYHWRNMSAEMPCYFGKETERYKCADVLKETRKVAEIASDSVVDLLKKEHIKCLYVACPLWSLEIVDILSKRMPREDIIISGDLDVPDEYKLYFEDYNLLSLVEQEIAYHAAIFISAGMSNWSDFVKERRDSEGKITFNIRELAGIPKDVDIKII